MPAKAVVFNSIRKHDGNQFRLLEPGEYTQMAGRAGRRGLDKVGTVILCCFGEVPPPHSTIRQMLTGTSTRLSSNFRLTYGMILNLLKSEAELSVAAMIKWSFSEFATQRALAANKFPQLLIRGERTLQKLDEQFQTDSAQWIGVDDLEDYFAVCSELLTMNNRVLCHLRESDYLSFNDICHPGRIILITAARSYHVVRAPAIVLRSAKPDTSVQGKTSGLKSDYLVCFVLMPSSFTHEEHGGHGTVAPFGHVGHIGRAKQRCFAIREVEIYQVLLVSHRKNTIDSKLLLEDDLSNKGLKPQKSPGHFYGASDPFAGMKAVRKPGHDISSGTGTMKKNAAVDEIMTTLLDTESAERKGNGIAILPLSPFLKRGSDVVDYRKLCDRAECLTRAMRSFTSHQHPNLEKYYKNIERKDTLRSRVQMLRHLLSNESLHLFPDFLQRKNVLLRLGYIEQNESVLLKGRVACEVNTCEELLITEIVFEGLLNDLDPPEFVAVLSGLVWQEKTKDQEFDDELPQKLVVCCNSMKVIATNLGWIQKEAGLSIDPGEYCDASLRFGLVHVVYEWALGIAFRNICELTDAHEGSIVRCITRLDELCREVRNIARVMGNPTLYRTAEAASSCIKRDIVFASSLYVS